MFWNGAIVLFISCNHFRIEHLSLVSLFQIYLHLSFTVSNIYMLSLDLMFSNFDFLELCLYSVKRKFSP